MMTPKLDDVPIVICILRDPAASGPLESNNPKSLAFCRWVDPVPATGAPKLFLPTRIVQEFAATTVTDVVILVAEVAVLLAEASGTPDCLAPV